MIEPFTIYDDASRQVIVPPGVYSFGETVINVQTGGQRMFSGRLTFRSGGFFGGTRDNIGGQLSWKQSRNFILTLNYDLNDINLRQGDFITRLMRFTTETNFSSNLSWINLVQYDNVSEVLGINTRLSWIPAAGQQGLIVLNHRLQDPETRQHVQVPVGGRQRQTELHVSVLGNPSVYCWTVWSACPRRLGSLWVASPFGLKPMAGGQISCPFNRASRVSWVPPGCGQPGGP